MQIALLNKRIQIQEESAVSDSIGNRTNSWTDFYECAATISNETGSVQQQDGQYENPIQISFTIRYCKKASLIKPLTHRVLFESTPYEIVGVDHQSYKGDWIKLNCKKEPV